jgi:RNA polymerase sigma factor for flagellar operon FliA
MTHESEPEPTFADGDTLADVPPPGRDAEGFAIDDAPTTVGRTDAEIEALVAQGIGLVTPLARKIAHQARRPGDVDELGSVGRTALFEAARSWEPERSPYVPYATNKVRWAMIDALRRITHGRSSAARVGAMSAHLRVAEVTVRDDTPRPETEARYEEELRSALASQAAALFVGLASGPTAEASTEPEDGPDVLLMRRRASVALREAMKTLPDRQREIVERHYFGGERFDHIAESLGVSKSWLSRLHAQAIEALGRAIGEH